MSQAAENRVDTAATVVPPAAELQTPVVELHQELADHTERMRGISAALQEFRARGTRQSAQAGTAHPNRGRPNVTKAVGPFEGAGAARPPRASRAGRLLFPARNVIRQLGRGRYPAPSGIDGPYKRELRIYLCFVTRNGLFLSCRRKGPQCGASAPSRECRIAHRPPPGRCACTNVR